MAKLNITSRKNSFTSINAAILLIGSLCCASIVAECKSFSFLSTTSFKDPLVAMPSGEVQRMTVAHETPVYQQQSQQQQQTQEVTYVLQTQPDNQNQHQPQTIVYEQQQPQQQVEHQQYILNPTVRLVPRGEAQQSRQQEQEPQAEAGRDYPGEILYIGQNNEIINPAQAEAAQNQQANNDLSGVAQHIARSSGMAATILTEIPVNEMPSEVLEKLKKDYGVKVVATRERPGANLVINCDEYNYPENSICSRQQPAVHNASPYSYLTSNGEEQPPAGYSIAGQPESEEHVTYTREADQQGQSGQPETDYASREASAAQEENQHEGYGSRTMTSSGHEERASEPRSEGEAEAAVSAAAARSHGTESPYAATQSETGNSSEPTDQPNSGFEEQPKNAEEEPKPNGEYYATPQK